MKTRHRFVKRKPFERHRNFIAHNNVQFRETLLFERIKIIFRSIL